MRRIPSLPLASPLVFLVCGHDGSERLSARPFARRWLELQIAWAPDAPGVDATPAEAGELGQYRRVTLKRLSDGYSAVVKTSLHFGLLELGFMIASLQQH